MLEQHDGLNTGDVKPLAAARIQADGRVVLADHVGAGAGEALPVFLAGARREGSLLPANHPAQLVFGLLPAGRTIQARLVPLFAFLNRREAE